MSEWKTIESAPTDREIYVSDPDCGAFIMRWNPTGTNPFFAPGDVGIWEAPNREMTWRSGENGPSYWKEADGDCDGWDKLPLTSDEGKA